jgi:MFS family permease
VQLFRRIQDRNIFVIAGAVFILGLAYGISIALVSLYLSGRGYTEASIGDLAGWFALGIVLMSLPMDRFIRRFTARKTLIGSLFGYACAVFAFPLAQTFTQMAAIRAIDGACSVGVWVSCETILLSRSTKDNKAVVMSLYAMSMAVGYILGPFIAKAVTAFAPMHSAFFVSGGVALASVGLIALKLDPDLPPQEPKKVETRGYRSQATLEVKPASSVLWRIKTACFATFAYGYFQASVVLFLPLFLKQQKGISEARTILIPAFFALGMLLFSNGLGRLGDKLGHLVVMRTLAAIGLVMILGFVYLDNYYAMCAAVFVAGATLASLSPLSLALQGVAVERSEYSRANAVYNVFYAGGMLFGPILSSRIFGSTRLGAAGGVVMLYHLAALWALFVVFAVVFRKDDPRAKRPPAQPATLTEGGLL